ncbi:MAG: hypothetical protein ACTSWE_02850 [Promethearchaeota archaeon]
MVMDKEYYQKAILKYLDKKKFVYIVPVKESKKLKAMKEAALNDPKKRVQTCEMKTITRKKRAIPSSRSMPLFMEGEALILGSYGLTIPRAPRI